MLELGGNGVYTLMPGDYLEEALYGAYVGTVTVDGPTLSDHEGGDPSRSRKPPGQTDYGPIRLERGVIYDLESEKWANKVWTYGNAAGQEVSLKDSPMIRAAHSNGSARACAA